ncbi:hypothetical protein [Paenibacillus silviterrae]|uniref:hypothetical protein n=1 Tax=Paenibacillus silviterrae TaxID=3242194 RepID=UPI002543087F|nr:hypothetical protein [Paenibacillus chinjuensis]
MSPYTFTYLNGQLSLTNGLSAKADLTRTAGTSDHEGTEVVFFQLLKGTMPVSYVALESDIAAAGSFTGHFDLSDPENTSYQTHVFEMDKLELQDNSLPVSLSNKLEVK